MFLWSKTHIHQPSHKHRSKKGIEQRYQKEPRWLTRREINEAPDWATVDGELDGAMEESMNYFGFSNRTLFKAHK